MAKVLLQVVNRETKEVTVCGFAKNCKMMLNVAYPGLPPEVFERDDVIKMMDEVDNGSGSLYVLEPVEGLPLIANSSLEKLLEDYNASNAL